jgi:DnaD/phage-associated family protein
LEEGGTRLNDIAFSQWLLEGGQITIPLRLMENLQSLNLTAENLGYLVLALTRMQQSLTPEELAQDRWIKWSLSEGWAQWQGQGEKRTISFLPLWHKLYQAWEENLPAKDSVISKEQSGFDYGRILKWLDHTRGNLTLNLREKQVIQEFNLKYGWSTEFILIFLQLCFERGLTQVQAYQPVAKRVYESGIYTVNDLITYMNELDWMQYKVTEVKKCIGQYGGVTKPQKEMYLKWHRQWGFSHEVIMRAAAETVRTNNPSFSYIDGVLQNWREKGVKDLKSAELALTEFDQKQQTKRKSASDGKRYSRADKRDLEKMLGLD